MKDAIAALALLICSCGVDTSSAITPAVADGSDLDAWTSEVQDAITAWQSALGPGCTFPISVGPSGAPITLVPIAELVDARARTYTGSSMLDVIEIRVRDEGDAASRRGVIMHELGHVIGLEHDPATHSIMHAPSTVDAPSDDDAAHAWAALGC